MDIFKAPTVRNNRIRFGQIDFHFMSTIDFDHSVALQRRLVYESSGRRDGHVSCLLCEHPPTISIGRAGSRRHITISPQELRRRKIELRWIGRGGACIAHTPGQLAVYPIVPLQFYNWSVGDYLQRLQDALLDTLKSMQITGYKRPGRFGLWGKSGMLAAIGVSVQNWTTSHGAFLNVGCGRATQLGIEANPAELACPGDPSIMSSLLEETATSPTIKEVAERISVNLAKRFGNLTSTWNQGHPLYPEIVKQARDRSRKAAS